VTELTQVEDGEAPVSENAVGPRIDAAAIRSAVRNGVDHGRNLVCALLALKTSC
jgi:hypothetical protein